jgi:hypothetical protein
MDKINFSLESYKNIQELIKFTDQKAGVLLVISGIVLSTFLQFSNKLVLFPLVSASPLERLIYILGVVTVLSLLIIIYILINNILKPRLAKNYNKNEFSLFYFEHITSLGKEKLYFEYAKIEDTEILQAIINQQYEISIILELKIKALNQAFNILLLAIASLSFFIILSRVV